MAEHFLKTWPEPFWAIHERRKTYEVRHTRDRKFQEGDVLVLQEWQPMFGRYTGLEQRKRVIYMTSGGEFGLPADVCVMGLADH